MKNLLRNLFSLALVAVLLLGSSASAAGAGNNPASTSLAATGQAPQPVWLHYDPNAIPVSVPPPAQFFQPHPQAATFAITYIPNGGTDPFGDDCLAFPEEAKAAFTNAANYWASLLTSAVPIRIQACWAPLGGTILGGSASLNSFANFSKAPVLNTWYPVALANALQGSDLDTIRDDMAIVYSSDYATHFYYGTGPVPINKIDFTTVVMHEIGHGLGFAGSMDMCNSKGTWGYWSCSLFDPLYPDTYDRFAVDGAGHGLIDPAYYANNSAALASALKSNNVYFTGENAKAANGGSNVKLYTPPIWQAGSSYSHLDYLTFGGGVNNLMVYAIGSGYAVHDPGPVGMGVLKDVGWAPFAPGGLTITSSNSSQMHLSWTSNNRNQTGFKVERSADGLTNWSQIGTPTGTIFTDSGLPTNDYFFYRVRAYHALGDSLPSNVVPNPLAAPGSLTATASAPGQVDLAWTDTNSSETNYQVSRSISGANSYQLLMNLPVNSNAYSDTSASPGVSYDYEVRAVNSSRNPGPSLWIIASAVTPLNPPLGLAASEVVFPSQVTLSWQDTNNNETGYQVESSPAGANTWTVMCTTPVDATGCSGTGLAEVAPYDFQVRAINSVAASAVVSTSAVTTLLAPTGLMAEPFSTTLANLHWTNHSTLATGIELQRSDDGLTGWTTLPPAGLPPSAASYTDTDVTVGTMYHYRVRATGGTPAENSPFTPVLHIVTGPNWLFIPVINR